MAKKTIKSNAKSEIIKQYLKFSKKHGRVPSLTELVELGVPRSTLRHNFGNTTGLHSYMRENYLDKLDTVVDEFLFTPKNFDQLKKEVTGYKRFVITTVVSGFSVNKKAFKALKNYCKRNNALPLFLPCKALGSSPKGASEWVLDPILKDEQIVFKDLSLNKNLYISSIKLSAKQINPLTGLSRIGQRNGSFIYASPKQYLEYVATSNQKKIPRSLMTTGAITDGNYDSEYYMSQRTAYIAEHDHTLGGVVVELDGSKAFHFRQIQFHEKDGSFRDLGVVYKADGKVAKDRPTVIPGDWHVGSTDMKVRECVKEVIEETKAETLILHDFFDGYSINHHHEGRLLKKVMKSRKGTDNLANELQMCSDELTELSKWIKGEIVLVKSNHDEVLQRYLMEARYAQDVKNHYEALHLAIAMLEGVDPLQAGVESSLSKEVIDKLVWLKRDQDYKVAGVECGAHGDLGSNGSRGSLRSLEKAYGNCVVGHSHTAAIYRGVYQVGTSTKLQLEYNRGPSSWTQTFCLVYSDGSRQLINVINGQWRLKDK